MNRLNLIMLSGLLARLALAVRNNMLGPQLGLESDAQSFYFRMVVVARSGRYEVLEVGESLTLNTMGYLMSILGETVLVACALSSIVWWISGTIFVATLGSIKAADRTKTLAAVAFAFWPTAIAYTAITLREPFQLLFICAAVHGCVLLMATRNQTYWFLIVIGLVGAGSLHGGLTAFAIAILGMTVLFYALLSGQTISFGRVFTAALLTGIIGFFGLNLVSGLSYDISNGVLNSAQSFQEKGVEVFGRTNYKSDSSSAGLLGSIFALPSGLFQYLFEPMPFRISTPSDVILFFENLVRISIIVISVQELRHSKERIQRLFLLFLFTSYLLLEAIWSLGTVNWGTASRHHVPAMGLLLLCAVAAWTMRKARLRTAALNGQLKQSLR